jgi:hypothetical protein
MMNSLRQFGVAALSTIITLVLVFVLFGVDHSAAVAQTAGWSQPFKLSEGNIAWFPDIAADLTGRVHVVWTTDELNYRSWDGQGWTQISGIASPPLDMVDAYRSAIAVDQTGYLHLFYHHLKEMLGYYSYAPVDQAGRPRAWSNPQIIGDSGGGYYTAIAIDSKNRIHAVYTDQPPSSRLADIFYRRSEDGGLTWLPPVNLSNSPQLGSSRPQIIVDQFNTIHVSWDEGFDQRSGEGTAQTSKYVFSSDGGETWSSPAIFGTSKTPSAQLVVDSSTKVESRVAVWRSSIDDNVYYQISSNNGKSWSVPSSIPGILARPWNSPPFDQYAMARDDRGIVHLVLVGRHSAGDIGWILIHVEWNGNEWSRPEVILDRSGAYPEYPRIAIALGGQLHVVWFNRSDVWSEGTKSVWYSYKTVSALNTPIVAFPTPTVNFVTPTLALVASPTKTLTKPQFTTVDSPPTSAFDSVLPLVMGIGATLLSIAVALVIRRWTSVLRD